MIALRDFAYTEQGTGRQVRVTKGQTIDQVRLQEHRVDLDKLARVKFVGQDEAGVVVAKRPGRKRRA